MSAMGARNGKGEKKAALEWELNSKENVRLENWGGA